MKYIVQQFIATHRKAIHRELFLLAINCEEFITKNELYKISKKIRKIISCDELSATN